MSRPIQYKRLVRALETMLDAFDLDDLSNFTPAQRNAILDARHALAEISLNSKKPT